MDMCIVYCGKSMCVCNVKIYCISFFPYPGAISIVILSLYVRSCYYNTLTLFLVCRFIMELSIGDELAVVTYGAAARDGFQLIDA
jgi:hypothetical protein